MQIGARDAERQSFDRLDLCVDLHAVSGPFGNIRCYSLGLKAEEDKSLALAIDFPVMEDRGVQAYRHARRMALELRPKLHICYLLSLKSIAPTPSSANFWRCSAVKPTALVSSAGHCIKERVGINLIFQTNLPA